MTVQQTAIVFFSMLVVYAIGCGSCLVSLERKVAKYHRQELKAIAELKDAIELYGFLDLEPWKHGGTFECVLTPCKIKEENQ